MNMAEGILIASIGFLGLILGIAIQEFRRWRERQELYHSMIFKERLQKHQEAFEFCHKLNVVLNFGESKKINKIAKEFRDWWNANCLYLDDESRKNIIPLINHSYAYAKKDDEIDNSVWDYLNKTLSSLTCGIGVKYLPDAKKETKKPK